MKIFDPLKLTEVVKRVVLRDSQRKYYRIARGGRWYGGIATADCVGCNLKCVFCWSNKPRDYPERIGRFYTPEEVFKALEQCAIRKGYKQIRISGNEPTIGRSHLLKVLELVDSTNLLFILETNGILIGNDKSYARDLAKFKRLHVRVSIKGTSPEEFSKLTGAIPEAFELQLKSLENLLNAGVSCHPAVMLSFSGKEGFKRILERLKEIDPTLCEELEEEYVFLYPHVVKRLSASGITPLIAFSPKNIPEDLI